VGLEIKAWKGTRGKELVLGENKKQTKTHRSERKSFLIGEGRLMTMTEKVNQAGVEKPTTQQCY